MQGPQPQNITFLVHEIFESLIMESFNGVDYELYLPCPDCIHEEVNDYNFIIINNDNISYTVLNNYDIIIIEITNNQ